MALEKTADKVEAAAVVETQSAAEAPKPETKTKVAEAKPEKIWLSGNDHTMYDPYTGQAFPPNTPVAVPELTAWHQMQLEATPPLLVRVGSP